MDTNTTTQLSHKFESALSEILPDLYQLLQRYQVSETYRIDLVNLDQLLPAADSFRGFDCHHDGVHQVNCFPRVGVPYISNTSGLTPNETQQFSTDLASLLSTILPRIRESIQQIDGGFEVNLLINSASLNSSQLSCEFIDGVLLCSDQPQGAIAS